MAAKGLQTPECSLKVRTGQNSLKVRTEQDSKEKKRKEIADDLEDEIMKSQVTDSELKTEEEEWKEDYQEPQEGAANFDLTDVVDEYESPPKKPKLDAEEQVDQVVRKETNSAISGISFQIRGIKSQFGGP